MELLNNIFDYISNCVNLVILLCILQILLKLLELIKLKIHLYKKEKK